MAELQKQVRRVARRLNFQRFLDILVWCWLGAMALALGWVVTEKLWRPVLDPAITVAACLGLGTLVAAVVWFFIRQSAVDAALALDQAFGLKERVSTTLTLPAELRESDAGVALLADTTQRIETIDVSEKFGLRLPRTAWLPLLPAALVFVVVMFVGQIAGTDTTQAKADTSKEREQVEKATKVLAKRLDEQREKAKEQGFGEAEKLLAELTEKANKELAEPKDIDKTKALSKLNNIQDAIKDRREKLGSTEQMQQQLEKLKGLSDKGPADKFHDALKHGDMKKAAEELSKLAEQMKTGKMDDHQKQALQKQLAQMKQELQKLANIEERKKELEKQLKQAGAPEEVIKQELEKLDAQAKEMEKLQELAEKLGKAAEAMDKGDMQKALENMQMSMADLQQMLKDLQEMQMLEKALDELAEMKNRMVCKNCGGAG